MSKRPELLLLLIGFAALIIAGVLACTHQTVPSWDITVIVATLVGGGVAIPAGGPVGAVLPKVEAAIESIVAAHRSSVDAVLREVAAMTTPPADPVTSVTPPGHDGDNQAAASGGAAVTSVTTTTAATMPADPTGG